MAIKSRPFGCVLLSDEDAKKFIYHMDNDGSNDKIKFALQKGREAIKTIKDREQICQKQ